MVIHSVTSARKAQVKGSSLTRPAAAAGCPAGAMVFARGRLVRLDLRQVHARSIAGTCQVHHCLYPGAARAGVVRTCAPFTDPAVGRSVMPSGEQHDRRQQQLQGDGRERCGCRLFIRAGQAACRYSWRVPPSRSRLRTSKCAIRSGSAIGSGSGRRGAAARRVRWVVGVGAEYPVTLRDLGIFVN